MKALGHIATRSLLPLSGQCAFACAAFGSTAAMGNGNYRHSFFRQSQRPVSFGREDRMHPGKGGA